MKKTTIKERAEKAVNAFFEAERNEPNDLTVVGNTAIISNEATTEFSQKADKYYSTFKKIFLFFPGVLMLHIASVSFPLLYNEIGITSEMLFWFAAGIFMTWAGIGDLKNIKHSFIPLSVILLGIMTGSILNFLPISAFEYSLLLFPLFFIAPILTKNAVDKFEENETELTS